jgi:hypothetical protein
MLNLGSPWTRRECASLDSANRCRSFALCSAPIAVNLPETIIRSIWTAIPNRSRARFRLCLGGGGRRMLTLAAQQADIVGINLNLRSGLLKDISANFAPEACDQKVAWVNQVNPNRELHMLVGSLSVTNHKEAELQRFAQELETDPEILRDSPHVLVGSVSEVVTILLARRERWGLSYVTVREDVFEAFAPVMERLGMAGG